uniref:CB1 cannabinoid receptor-interacting protein 1 n=1 Tax=Strigamia maritima TaxID=126957 RepID=T1JGP9_STRMM
MEHQLHFKLTLELKREKHDGPAYFKVDGNRFKNPRTIKLHSDSAYAFCITSRPPQILESLSIHGTSLDVEEKSRDHSECVYSAVWSTAGILPTRKGEREQVPIIIKISEKGTLKACFQAKMYKAEDEQHCAWGSSLHSIEWECNANEHRNHVDVAKETFH